MQESSEQITERGQCLRFEDCKRGGANIVKGIIERLPAKVLRNDEFLDQKGMPKID